MHRTLRRLLRKRIQTVLITDKTHHRYGQFGVVTSRAEDSVWVCFGEYEPFFEDYASECFFDWQVLTRALSIER